MKQVLLSFLLSIVLASILTSSSAFGQNTLVISACEDSAQVVAIVDTVLLANVPAEFKKDIIYRGNPAAVGYFYDGFIFNFENPDGLVLSTGFAEEIGQSNVCSGFISGTTGGGSDTDLTQLSGSSINDACIIEFDLALQGDSIFFYTVFASEEYHEWINPLFADAYGWFMSGPGINGAYSNNAVNIGEIPGEHSPVGIPNLNCGDQDASCLPPPGYGPNCEWLIDNGDITSETFQQLAFDAFTKPLPAGGKIYGMQWYHYKIAIGDALDAAYDSGIFLEGGAHVFDSVYVSIKEPSLSYGFQIIPNPARDYFEVKSNDNHKIDKISIFDLSGRLLKIEEQVEREINLSGLPKGLLIIELTSGNYTFREKLLHR